MPEPDIPVEDREIPLLGGRRFWVYRGHLGLGDPTVVLREPFAELASKFDPEADGPIGLCVVLTGDQIKQMPEAEWADPRMLYAGYVDGRGQVRVTYFPGARITPPAERGMGSATPLEASELPGFSIRPFADQDEVAERDVLAFWADEHAIGPDEARARLGEMLLVATDDGANVVGVSSAGLRRNEQLWMPMWHYRVFVGSAYRRSHLAVALTRDSRDHLERRYVSGEDTRAGGIVMAIQNAHLRRLDDAIWQATDFAFFGVNAGGDHLRVRYFPGATAPGPRVIQRAAG